MSEQSLQDFVQKVNGESHLRVEHDFGDGFVRLRTSEAERRQAAQDIQSSEDIVLELLRNSRDAHAKHVYLAVSKEADKRIITVIDDGDGIPNAMHTHVFEPRVTSKLDTSHMDAWGLHGRGMALYSISENASCAYVSQSDTGLGCAIHVQTDTQSLKEKADQSTFPRFELVEGGQVNIRGPKNILRTACEFAIESRDSCAVYIGSPAEVAATLYAFGSSTLSAIEKAFCKDVSELPLVKRLATSSDPDDFADIAASLGLALSSRTARRILDGQLVELGDLLGAIELTRPGSPRKPSKGKHRSQKPFQVKLQREDVRMLSEAVSKAYSELAEQYYLDPSVDPVIRVQRDKLTITLPLIES